MSNFFSSLVLAFLLFVASFDATNKIVSISELCKQTKNPLFCSTLLNSSPGEKDLVSLGQFTIDVVRADVTNAITLLKSLVEISSRDPKAKAHYENCLKFFGEGAIDDIDDTQQALQMRDYLAMGVHASSLLDRVGNCVSGAPGEPVFHDPSLIPKFCDVIEQVTSIILVISKDLRGA